MTHAPPAPDPTADPVGALERELRILVRRAASSAAQTARRVHPELDASAYPLLAHIHLNPGTRGSDLAAHFGVGRATVSRQLSRLAQLGLIHREVDPEDTRGQQITLTDDGEARFAAARDGRIDALGHALAEWDPADVAQLATLLRRYSESWVRWRDAHSTD
ncbi:transcriptional regulator, MarR family [Xylanimonas cellulosilytica DSM 15894]|uniref:Transcriptional regulator, MarR family n=1 Tax=Xylanimonas cellulosilytica (strain DSM 15894 / JCM 12276 / CECT 5975 / KCTC 9989 / LMG 20990 / NBRC 107835 / XIL07) TaxID=446471 RepID=D1BUU3_XYLCX|nr:MarR family transcriptional regulator [Xylanimonas cellulosilytica]ACZ29334.1 transcriptional regulator, MarR family [Xylanimonas cellulosilytica DSM 15894]